MTRPARPSANLPAPSPVSCEPAASSADTTVGARALPALARFLARQAAAEVSAAGVSAATEDEAFPSLQVTP